MRYLANYHAHTMRCGHARGAEEDYVQAAIANGFQSIAFTDHGPWPFRTSYVSPIRMRMCELESYVDTVQTLRDRYADRIRIHLGMEYEAYTEFFPWLSALKERYGFEYFILGNHLEENEELGRLYFGDCVRPEQLECYLSWTLKGMRSGLFTYLAHPDLCLLSYPRFDETAERVCRTLCREANRLSLPMEYNLLGRARMAGQREEGMLGYCTPEFWRIAAEEGCRAIIGVDAHSPEAYDCVPRFEAARAELQALGIEVLDRLEQLDP